MISIAAGALTKFTVLPLALLLGTVWVIFTIRNSSDIFPIVIKEKSNLILFFILLILIFRNLSIYGYNIVAYNKITPRVRRWHVV